MNLRERIDREERKEKNWREERKEGEWWEEKHSQEERATGRELNHVFK